MELRFKLRPQEFWSISGDRLVVLTQTVKSEARAKEVVCPPTDAAIKGSNLLQAKFRIDK